MRRLRRLVRHQSGERLTIDGTDQGRLDLYTDLQGFRRKRNSVCDGVREFVGACGQHQCQPEHACRGCQLDPDVVFRQCDRLYGLRRLVGQQGDRRHTVDGCAHEQRDLHADL